MRLFSGWILPSLLLLFCICQLGEGVKTYPKKAKRGQLQEGKNLNFQTGNRYKTANGKSTKTKLATKHVRKLAKHARKLAKRRSKKFARRPKNKVSRRGKAPRRALRIKKLMKKGSGLMRQGIQHLTRFIPKLSQQFGRAKTKKTIHRNLSKKLTKREVVTYMRNRPRNRRGRNQRKAGKHLVLKDRQGRLLPFISVLGAGLAKHSRGRSIVRKKKPSNSSGNKPPKPSDNQPTDNKPTNNRPTDNNPTDNNPSGNNGGNDLLTAGLGLFGLDALTDVFESFDVTGIVDSATNFIGSMLGWDEDAGYDTNYDYDNGDSYATDQTSGYDDYGAAYRSAGTRKSSATGLLPDQVYENFSADILDSGYDYYFARVRRN